METQKEWAPIPGLEGAYEASSDGDIRSIDRTFVDTLGRTMHYAGKDLTISARNNTPYLRCIVGSRGKVRDESVHVLVCAAFHGPRPDGMWVRHLDGNPHNNAAPNLAWGTPKENMLDQYRHGTRLMADRMRHAKLTEAAVREIRDSYASGMTQVALADQFSVGQSLISSVIRRTAWAHVQ